jgi:hypothetical protein
MQMMTSDRAGSHFAALCEPLSSVAGGHWN